MSSISTQHIPLPLPHFKGDEWMNEWTNKLVYASHIRSQVGNGTEWVNKRTGYWRSRRKGIRYYLLVLQAWYSTASAKRSSIALFRRSWVKTDGKIRNRLTVWDMGNLAKSSNTYTDNHLDPEELVQHKIVKSFWRRGLETEINHSVRVNKLHSIEQ